MDGSSAGSIRHERNVTWLACSRPGSPGAADPPVSLKCRRHGVDQTTVSGYVRHCTTAAGVPLQESIPETAHFVV